MITPSEVSYFPIRIEIDPEVGLLSRRLWCPLDCSTLDMRAGKHECACGIEITVSADDVAWVQAVRRE
jgi:hypothetical protein